MVLIPSLRFEGFLQCMSVFGVQFVGGLMFFVVLSAGIGLFSKPVQEP
jgi:hypothetical protein